MKSFLRKFLVGSNHAVSKYVRGYLVTSPGGRWIESCVWMQEDVSGFFMGNYAQRSSFRTLMGPLYMIPRVWCDKDGAMVSFLWKLWASSYVCDGHIGRLCGAFWATRRSNFGNFWL